MDISDEGRWTCVNAKQSLKAPDSIWKTPSGILTTLKEQQPLKALCGMTVIYLGRLKPGE